MNRRNCTVFLGFVVTTITPALLPLPLAAQIPGIIPEDFIYLPSSSFPSPVASTSEYFINSSSGVPEPAFQSPFASASDDGVTAMDPKGRFVFLSGSTANGNDFVSVINGYSINPYSGAFNPTSQGSLRPPGNNVLGMRVDPTGRFLYVAEQTDIATYAIDAGTGSLTLMQQTTPIGGQQLGPIVLTPNGGLAYVGDTGLASGIHVYAVNITTGALTAIPGAFFPISDATVPSLLAMSPSGKFLYTCSQGQTSGELLGFTINTTTGFLTKSTEIPVPSGFIFLSIAIHPSGKVLYASEAAATPLGHMGLVEIFAADSTTGSLTVIPGASVSAGNRTNGGSALFNMTFDCTGKYLYAAASLLTITPSSITVNSLAAYSADAETGLLTPIPGSPFLTQLAVNGVAIGCPATPPPDTIPPVSRVSPLPVAESYPNFLVKWSGTDTGYGIEFYTIFVSDNGGSFTPWLTQTAATQAWYPGLLGHTYGFFSQATDWSGNIEHLKSAAEATTQTPVQSPEDVNGDGQINCIDLAAVKGSFGKKTGQPGFNPAADVNKDGVVTILDLSLVTQKADSRNHLSVRRKDKLSLFKTTIPADLLSPRLPWMAGRISTHTSRGSPLPLSRMISPVRTFQVGIPFVPLQVSASAGADSASPKTGKILSASTASGTARRLRNRSHPGHRPLSPAGRAVLPDP